MALPSSGTIKMSQVRDELKKTGPISLGNADVRKLGGKPSGTIKMSDLYGKSATKLMFEGYTTWLAGDGMFDTTVSIIGGGSASLGYNHWVGGYNIMLLWDFPNGIYPERVRITWSHNNETATGIYIYYNYPDFTGYAPEDFNDDVLEKLLGGKHGTSRIDNVYLKLEWVSGEI